MKNIAYIFISVFLCILLSACSFMPSIPSTQKTNASVDVKLSDAIVGSPGNLEAVKEAIADGADVNQTAWSDRTLIKEKDHNPVALAISAGHQDMAEYLLQEGADPNYGDDVTLLMYAVDSMQYQTCLALLNAGADVQAEGNSEFKGLTALDMAIMVKEGIEENDYIKFIDVLIEKGAVYSGAHFEDLLCDRLETATLNSGSNYFLIQHLLKKLIDNNKEPIVDELLKHVILGDEKKAEKYIKTDLHEDNKKAVMFFAAAFCDSDFIEKLSKSGCDLFSRNHLNNSLLEIACKYNSIDVVNYFISNLKNQDIDALNKAEIASAYNSQHPTFLSVVKEKEKKEISTFSGETLIVAAGSGNLVLLKEAGENVTKANTQLKFEILKSAALNNQTAVLSYLIKKGWDINLKWQSYGLLSEVILSQKDTASQTVDWLIKNGADINTDASFSYAVLSRNIEQVDILLRNGADVNSVYASDNATTTPLHCAIQCGSLELVKLLVEKGAQLEYKTPESCDTAITLAAQEGSYRIVEYLKISGADCRHKNKNQETALDIAQSTRDEKMELILEK